MDEKLTPSTPFTCIPITAEQTSTLVAKLREEAVWWEGKKFVPTFSTPYGRGPMGVYSQIIKGRYVHCIQGWASTLFDHETALEFRKINIVDGKDPLYSWPPFWQTRYNASTTMDEYYSVMAEFVQYLYDGTLPPVETVTPDPRKIQLAE